MSGQIKVIGSATDDLVEALSKLFGTTAARGVLPRANRWGIEVFYNQKDPGLVAFRWVTKGDGFAMNVEVKLQDAVADETYVPRALALVHAQIEEARKQKQENERIVIQNLANREQLKKLTSAEAVNEVLH